MTIRGIIKRGEYYDSVTLMIAAKRLRELPGVADSAVVMATRENKAILQASGMMIEDFVTSTDGDLLLAVKAEDRARAEYALAEAESILKTSRLRETSGSAPQPRTLDGAQRILPAANLALISVAGAYAGDLAIDALERGLHVMLFSDNVPIEREIELKRYALEHNLLVMGPDCGTAIIDGVPLAFANSVRRGNIGIVAASGTGLQEVSCLISNAGAGISQAIGTGGRDIKKEIGGHMFVESLRRLSEDPDTSIIVLISKPPHPEVLAKIEQAVRNVSKSIVAVFLGCDAAEIKSLGMIPAATLEEAALLAVAFSRGEPLQRVTDLLARRDSLYNDVATVEVRRLNSEQHHVRGLFSGGTFCYEAQMLLRGLPQLIYSNAPAGDSLRLENVFRSEQNTLIDLGADEFTVGRLHPMMDYALRSQRILQEAEDPETAVILFDVVLGYGANPDPLSELSPVIRKAQENAAANGRYLSFVCSVTGTDEDPQSRSTVVKGLMPCGVHVMDSNAGACRLAECIVSNKESQI